MPTPTRKGYKFYGWYTSKTWETKIEEDTSVDNKVTVVYARWKKYNYTINYQLNKGVNNKYNPSTYTVNDAITFKNPTRKGGIFKGWYSDSNFKNKVTGIKKGTTGNRTFYARWAATKYSITYNKNGGTGTMAKSTGIKYNTNYTLKANAFKVKKGYVFKEWNTKKDGTGKSFANKAVVRNLTAKNGGNVNLYARWAKVKYKITYELNKGTNNKANPATYHVKSEFTLKNPTRTGGIFKGWYSDANFKTKVTGIKKGTTGNKKFYARWAATKYSITYNANGGTGTMAKSTGIKYNTNYTLKANTFKVKKGYKFDEWNTKKDGSGKSFTNKAKVRNLTSKNGGIVTLYARWTKVNYKINYVLNDGMNSPSNPLKYKINETISFVEPTKTGYSFSGWYSDSKFKTKVTGIKKGSTGNKTFYAKWTKTNYVSNLHNKTAIFFGDSITYGSKSTPRGYSWANYIGDHFDIKESINNGVPRSRISNEIEDRWIINLINDCKRTDFNYVILHGGVNDIHASITLGSFDEDDFSGEYNNKTFLGGLETYIYTAKTKFPEAKIGYIINYQILNKNETIKTLSPTYYKEMKKVLDKWDIPYLDLFFGSAPNGYKYSKLLHVSTNEYLTDNVHLNLDGYKIISPYIYEWMDSL